MIYGTKPKGSDILKDPVVQIPDGIRKILAALVVVSVPLFLIAASVAWAVNDPVFTVGGSKNTTSRSIRASPTKT